MNSALSDSRSSADSVNNPNQPTTPARPPKVIGFADLFLFYVVTGISLRWIATAASAGPSAITIWIGAWCCFFIPLLLSVTELASRYPQEGGLYIWSKCNFGDFAGFIAAWTYWTSNLPYFPSALYFAASNAVYVGGARWKHLSDSPTYYICFSLLGLAVITILNVVGLNVAKWLHNVGAFGMWIPVAIIIVMGLIAWHRFGSATRFTVASLVPDVHLKNMIFWASLTFALGGSETASLMGDEVKNARSAIPRALFLGGIVVTLCYIFGTICTLLVLPSHQISDLQGLMQAITLSTERLHWFGMIPICGTLIAVSNIGAVGAYLAATARLPFVAGIDHVLPSAFGRLHPRWQTPYVALLVQSGVAAVFVFLGQAGTTVHGAYDVLVSMGIITYFVPYLFVFASMFRSQWREAEPGTFRVPGKMPAAIFLSCVGFLATSFTIVLSLIPAADEPNKLLATEKVVGLTGILILAGALLYWIEKGTKRELPAS